LFAYGTIHAAILKEKASENIENCKLRLLQPMQTSGLRQEIRLMPSNSKPILLILIRR
jgi:hypothetical protein